MASRDKETALSVALDIHRLLAGVGTSAKDIIETAKTVEAYLSQGDDKPSRSAVSSDETLRSA